MARRTVLAVPMPADLDDLLQVLTDVGQGWAGAKVELGPVTVDGTTMLVLTASRRRAQRPAPDEEPDDEDDPAVVRPIPVARVSRARDIGPEPLPLATDPATCVGIGDPGAWLDDPLAVNG